VTLLRSGSVTDVGRVRTVNEDFAVIGLTLFAVADGMGGHVGGEVASHTAIETLQHEFSTHPSAEGLAQAVRQANQAVWERGLHDPDLRGMGTTLTAAALVTTDEGDRLVMANVGDSRSYRLHDGELVQLSHDHSVAEELVDRGELSEAEAAVHPHRHILTRALGVSDEVDVDLWQMTPEAGDRYLLCSDGLTNELAEPRIAGVLASTPDPQKAAEALVRLANENGGNDNVTVIVLDVVVGEDRPPTVSPAPTGLAVAPPDGARQEAPGSSPIGVVTSSQVTSPAPSLLSRAGDDAASGMRAMTARAVEVNQRLRTRRITVRLLLFVVVLAAIVAAGYGAVRWYVDSSYFVKLHDGQVIIYEGRMGGFLGFEPKVAERTGVPASQVPPAYLQGVYNGVEEPSLKAARNYVNGLKAIEGADSQSQPSPTTPTTARG